MVQFYFAGAHLEFFEISSLIFSKIGTNSYQIILQKKHKTQMYPKYFLILFLAPKKQEFKSSLWIQQEFTFFGEQLLIIVEDWIV